MNKSNSNKIQLKHKILKMKISRKYVHLKMIVYFLNKDCHEIGTIKFFINDHTFIERKITITSKKLSLLGKLKAIEDYRFDIPELIDDNARINGALKFVAEIDGEEKTFYLKDKKKEKNTKTYYVPKAGNFVDNYAFYFRQSAIGLWIFVKRRMDDIEYTFRFRVLESVFVSAILFVLGKARKKTGKKINVYYEKFCSKAEEGTYELFTLSKKNKNSRNYYFIDENSEDYERIKSDKNVIRKYSLKYYWILYAVSTFISTESPAGHVNVLRTKNHFLCKAIYNAEFVFLQHGITYLKRHGTTSPFLKGRDGEAQYMIVGSNKEKKVCKLMLEYEDEQFIMSGLPIFDLVDYKHINQSSSDYVMIMLTWKPYEEHILDIQQTEYYSNLTDTIKVVLKYIDKEKLIIVGHPKVNDLLKTSQMNLAVWEKPLSEALEKTKLLITDYSSVCYNSFYQGAAVVFYQPDLEKYEGKVGKLIPNDDEYIGKRAFYINELDETLCKNIKNKTINLSGLRKEEHEKAYDLINEFHDGENINRIYKKLTELSIV